MHPRGKVWQLAEALATVAYLAGSDDVALDWMKTPRECWGGLTANEMIDAGRGAEVLLLVDEEFDACQNGEAG